MAAPNCKDHPPQHSHTLTTIKKIQLDRHPHPRNLRPNLLAVDLGAPSSSLCNTILLLRRLVLLLLVLPALA